MAWLLFLIHTYFIVLDSFYVPAQKNEDGARVWPNRFFSSWAALATPNHSSAEDGRTVLMFLCKESDILVRFSHLSHDGNPLLYQRCLYWKNSPFCISQIYLQIFQNVHYKAM